MWSRSYRVYPRKAATEETVYLLLFGAADEAQLDDLRSCWRAVAATHEFRARRHPRRPRRHDESLARSVLTLYSYDARATDNSTENVLRQCLQLIALFPMLSVYGYQAYSHYVLDKSLFIHNPVPELSTAENLLHILRADGKYTELEARILIWRWCCASTAAATTRPSPCMWFFRLQTACRAAYLANEI
ncbi:MAG: citrate/2-methylcitrate synthase [Ruthenibacterium lactatiformans]